MCVFRGSPLCSFSRQVNSGSTPFCQGLRERLATGPSFLGLFGESFAEHLVEVREAGRAEVGVALGLEVVVGQLPVGGQLLAVGQVVAVGN